MIFLQLCRRLMYCKDSAIGGESLCISTNSPYWAWIRLNHLIDWLTVWLTDQTDIHYRQTRHLFSYLLTVRMNVKSFPNIDRNDEGTESTDADHFKQFSLHNIHFSAGSHTAEPDNASQQLFGPENNDTQAPLTPHPLFKGEHHVTDLLVTINHTDCWLTSITSSRIDGILFMVFSWASLRPGQKRLECWLWRLHASRCKSPLLELGRNSTLPLPPFPTTTCNQELLQLTSWNCAWSITSNASRRIPSKFVWLLVIRPTILLKTGQDQYPTKIALKDSCQPLSHGVHCCKFQFETLVLLSSLSAFKWGTAIARCPATVLLWKLRI